MTIHSLPESLDFTIQNNILVPMATTTPVEYMDKEYLQFIRDSMDGIRKNSSIITIQSLERVSAVLVSMLERTTQLLCFGDNLLPSEGLKNSRYFRDAMRSFLEVGGNIQYKSSNSVSFIVANGIHILLEGNDGKIAIFNDAERSKQLIHTFNNA